MAVRVDYVAWKRKNNKNRFNSTEMQSTYQKPFLKQDLLTPELKNSADEIM